MNYQQLTIKTDKNSVDLITEICYGIDALSIDFSDSFDNPILEPPVGDTPLWEDITLKVLFAENVDKSFVLNTLKEICGVDGVFEFIKNKNWQEECNKLFEPLKFGKNLWVCPSWHDKTTLDGVVIEMDPGMAFGTGTHETTSLCLEHLSDNPPTDKCVIDFGTGTGVLAIAAKKLAAKKVIGIDNDPQSIISAKQNVDKNIDKNNCEITILNNEDFEKIKGENKTDVMIANILTNTLLEIRDYLNDLTKVGGKIILSGILANQQRQIIDSYKKYFDNFKVKQLGDWVLITADKK
jgi:ribosomal protein L11 methyltransferase